jgi:acetoin utilization deacetylase AcuC-like enzyme
MRIMTPPRPIEGGPDNTRKQEAVVRLCYDPAEDQLLEVPHLEDQFIHAVHDWVHVRAVREGKKLNGFSNADPAYLAHALRSCAALVSAAETVLNEWEAPEVVFAPVSGFHHAGYADCQGYCTFNGLMIAAKWALDSGAVSSVCIIDGDGHWGNGTQDIIDRLRLGARVNHVSLSHLATQGSHEEAQKRIRFALQKKPGLVLYQAGADAHIDDPYKSGYLTDEGWRERDMTVFSLCKDLKLPVVWNLAGGYNGHKTLTLHNDTFVSALRVYYPECYRLTHGLSPLLGSPAPASLPLADPE